MKSRPTLAVTTARLRLLNVVAEAGVIRDEDGVDFDISAGWVRVGGRMEEMSVAGWVRLDGSTWRLTEVGEQLRTKYNARTESNG